jgi:hypothetical protein
LYQGKIPVARAAAIDLARLDFTQKAFVLQKLLTPYISSDSKPPGKQVLRLFFSEWKVKAFVARDVLAQSMKTLQNHSFKRRWERPAPNPET